MGNPRLEPKLRQLFLARGGLRLTIVRLGVVRELASQSPNAEAAGSPSLGQEGPAPQGWFSRWHGAPVRVEGDRYGAFLPGCTRTLD